MILSIHQPSYFPWLGLLDKIRRSDVLMIMDEVQLSDSAFQHRNLFLTRDGQQKFLTIPFVKKGYLQVPFREIRIAAHDWRHKHLNFIKNNYGRHAYAQEIMPHLEEYFSCDYERLVDAVVASMRLTFDLFQIDAQVVFQSATDYDRSLRRGDLILELVRASGARCYLSGQGARAYLDESSFCGDLRLIYNEFHHPAYPQQGTNEFRSGLSGLDALFNLGVHRSRSLLRSPGERLIAT
jgi:hypothetical protein